MAGKIGVTYEQVAAAAERLVAEGRDPGIRIVRERLNGTGSHNTIQRHLKAWRDAKALVPAVPADLPSSIIREIQAELQRTATAARAEAEAQLARAEADAADLSAAGIALEAERDAMAEQIAALTTERDVLKGQVAEQASEIERVSRDLERERRGAEEARIHAGQGRLANDSLRQQVEELRADLARQRDDVAHERQARIDSERQLAGASAACEGLAQRLTELQEREHSAQRELVELRARLERSQEAASTAHVEASALRGQVVGMRDILMRAGAVVRTAGEEPTAHEVPAGPA